MSQFLLCQSEINLCKYGTKMNEVVSNKELYTNVIHMYFDEEANDSIWVINKVQDCFGNIKYDSNELDELYLCCKKMVFWYGNDYLNLDVIDSLDEFNGYFAEMCETPCTEIYLMALNPKK